MDCVIGEACTLVAANQSARWFQSKVELSFQSKVQLAVASFCLATYAAHIGHNKDAYSLAEDLKVRRDCHEMLLEEK